MKHKESFEQQLKELHQARKKSIFMPAEQKKSLLSFLAASKRPPFYIQAQFALGIAAVAVLFHFAYQRHSPNNAFVQYYEATVYDQVETHDYTNEQYSKIINHAHQQAQSARDHALRNLMNKELLVGRLMARDDNWYIESCDKTRLVELKADLIKHLNLKQDIDLSIKVGEALRIENNSQGQIIALIRPMNTAFCG